MKRNREENGSFVSSSPPPNSEIIFKKNVCFRLIITTDGRDKMEWYVFNPNKSPSSEKTETHRRCSRCPRPHRFEKSDLASFAGLAKHWDLTSFVILGSCIYCIGGHPHRDAEAREHFGGPIPYLKRVLRFDTNRPQEGWTKVSSMNKGRGSPSTVVLGGKIYVFGGYYYPDFLGIGDVGGPWAEVFDPVQDQWHALTDPPLDTKSLSAWSISLAALEEDEKILVGFYSACFVEGYKCLSYDVSNKRWEVFGIEVCPMPPAVRHSRTQVVDRTVYWNNREYIFAYDLDQTMLFSGRVKGLRRDGILWDDSVHSSWLLPLGGEHFGLICLEGAHKVSKSLFTCINCVVLKVSKSTKPNGKEGTLKLEITTQYVKSYFVEGRRRMLEPCLIEEGMLESDDGNVKDGSGSKTTVWGELSDCACI